MSASAGRVLIKPKGVYNQAIAYKKQDSVFFNGSSYICINDTLGHAPTDSEYWQIMAQGAGVISGAFSGACDSLGSAQVKSVIIPPADNFALQKGVIVGVRFTNTNTFEATSENSIALNVNNTGALPIYFGGTATPLGDNVVAFGEAAYTHFYQYDGSNWVFIGRSGVQTAKQTPYDNTDSGLTATDVQEAIDELTAEKANKVSGATSGNFAGLDASGNLTDSGKKASDFATDAEMSAVVNLYGSKNLNSYPYDNTTKTSNGITYTDNGDGTIFVGDANQAQTASGDSLFLIHNDSIRIKNGNYIATGCPSGGSDSSFSIVYEYRPVSSHVTIGSDAGNGLSFTVNGDKDGNDGATLGFYIIIKSGTTIPSGGYTFKPMIRDARISDDTYVPYAMTNKQITDRLEALKWKTIASKTPSSGETYSSVLSSLFSQIGSAFDTNVEYRLLIGSSVLYMDNLTANQCRFSRFGTISSGGLYILVYMIRSTPFVEYADGASSGHYENRSNSAADSSTFVLQRRG